MTDPVPSKERVDQILGYLNQCADSQFRYFEISPETSRELLAYMRSLQTALTGIQSCSTCEACRGAATIALGGTHTCIGNCGASVPGPNAYCEACFLKERRGARALAESAYRDGYGADLTDDRDLSERTHELIRSLSRPAHEREMPHCSSCSCPPYEASQPFEHPYAQHPHHVCTCGAKVPSDVYVLHTCGDRLTPKGSAPEPAAERTALVAVLKAIKDLNREENGKTLFEASPITSQAALDAWLGLNAAIARANEVLAQPPGDG